MAVVEAVLVVRVLLHRHLSDEEERHEARRGETGHRLPHRRHARRKRVADLTLQRGLERRDDGDDRVRDLRALGELLQKRGGQTPLELVLEDACRNRDAPCLWGVERVSATEPCEGRNRGERR